jgi:hypothetical protein
MIKVVYTLFFILVTHFLWAQNTADESAYKIEKDLLFQTNAKIWIGLNDQQNSFEFGWNQNWNDMYYGLISTDTYRARFALGFHRQVSEHWLFGFQSYTHFLDKSTFNMVQTQGYLLHMGKIGKTCFGQQFTLAHQFFGENTLSSSSGSSPRPAEGKAHLRALLAHPFALGENTTLWIQVSGYLAWQINWNSDKAIYKYNQRFIDQTQWMLNAGVYFNQKFYAGAYIQYTANYYQTSAAVHPKLNVRTPMAGIQCLWSIGKFDSGAVIPLFHP